MKHLKTIFFLLLCVGVGVLIGQAYVWWTRPPKRGFEHSEPTLITGIGDAPAQRGFTLQAADLAALPALLKQGQDLFATTIAIEYAPSLTRDALAQAATAVHRKKMTLLLLPAPVFTPENPYPRPLPDIAADAADAGVDFLCISWLSAPPDPAYWRQQAQAVRTAFPGKIILAGQPAVLPTVAYWGVADMIGAIGPIPLPRRLPNAPLDVTVHDERVAWDCVLTALESLAHVNNQKLALLHMNIPLEISAGLPAPGAENAAPAKNPALQSILYEALLLETKGRAETTNILIFNWAHPAQPDAPANFPALLDKFREAWDPKKPRPPEPELPPDDTPPDTPATDN